MSKHSRKDGIEFEPHLADAAPQLDPSEAQAEDLLQREWQKSKLADHVEHNVWEEPTLAGELNAPPEADQLTYANWLTFELQRTSREKTWLVALLVIAACGPLGIIGALFGGISMGGGGIANLVQLLGAVIMGPITEEITKVLLALWIVEKRPYLFSSPFQIMLCAIAGGLAFAAIENLIYFNIYVPQHTAAFELFRWTVCVALHVSCSTLAGIGLSKIWQGAIQDLRRPRLADGIPWFYAAMSFHGLYNFPVIVAETLGWLQFLKE
ncbi:PrsW family glutamic-type intramembrane protease [Adhaeretor mobilis]|uniref:PrsW family intramembrane metalloprotease n=1 Tax=Adhaeretor mobilis TaxID=1930276 RepID=A0A517MY38_9BACT|nr:PrsW family glutamic-type intramembrane protease [Adhaeretor mobilis]QDS99795.1 hypothetical protein HG15A2_31260 [Adhaeretor mobilis]